MSGAFDIQVLYEGRHVRLVSRDGWEFAERTNCSAVVLILAITDEGRLVFAEQERPPVAKPVIELPAGLVGDLPGEEEEPLEVAARRELLEETGYDAEHLSVLTAGPVSAGLSSEIITFVRAEGLRRVGDGGGDENEDITVHEVPLDEVPAWLSAQERRGALVDPKVYIGLYFASRGGTR